jgi:hypothetical protein
MTPARSGADDSVMANLLSTDTTKPGLWVQLLRSYGVQAGYLTGTSSIIPPRYDDCGIDRGGMVT